MAKTNLEIFDRINGTLEIELSEPAEQIAPNLLNEKASACAKITSVSLEVDIDDPDEGDKYRTRPLTKEELDTPVIQKPNISISGLAGRSIDHIAPNGSYFSIQDVLKAIEETERQTRNETEWFGGVDIHHTFFEGIDEEDGKFFTYWGS